MKKLILSVSMFALSLSPAWAGETTEKASVKASSEFETVKSFAGKWEGTSKKSNGTEQPAVVEYRVTSGGSAVMETLFPGTPHEMVSVYHDKNGKLAMTHYCMLGNQPELELGNSSSDHIDLESSNQTRIALAGQMYMSSLVLEQPAKDQLIQTWKAVGPDGKQVDTSVFTLKKTASTI